MQVFTPRKQGSNWSKTNKKRVRKLTKNGLMQPAGQKKLMPPKKTVHGILWMILKI